ncbi:hypothetical protein BDW74DRAFT_179141 [Aspergillus multicolor]|uniref:uncharacterized protein n=1 Tax=Aspergillus multicolor TaxID=41759 RepID=UPI003CCD04DC
MSLTTPIQSFDTPTDTPYALQTNFSTMFPALEIRIPPLHPQSQIRSTITSTPSTSKTTTPAIAPNQPMHTIYLGIGTLPSPLDITQGQLPHWILIIADHAAEALNCNFHSAHRSHELEGYAHSVSSNETLIDMRLSAIHELASVSDATARDVTKILRSVRAQRCHTYVQTAIKILTERGVMDRTKASWVESELLPGVRISRCAMATEKEKERILEVRGVAPRHGNERLGHLGLFGPGLDRDEALEREALVAVNRGLFEVERKMERKGKEDLEFCRCFF